MKTDHIHTVNFYYEELFSRVGIDKKCIMNLYLVFSLFCILVASGKSEVQISVVINKCIICLATINDTN